MKIGHTPTIRLKRIEEYFGVRSALFGKAEFMNPAGSIKDRVAEALVDSYEAQGILSAGGVIVEATSGNTGIALAMIGALRGYRVKITMPEGASEERVRLMRAYGAEVMLSKAEDGMTGAIRLAEDIAKSTQGAVMVRQFDAPVCVRRHYEQTAPELYQALNGRIDALVAGVGTGATLMGMGRFLLERCGTRIYAVEPAESPVLSGGKRAVHGIDGIGAGFVPTFYIERLVQSVIKVSTKEAEEMTRVLARQEGVLVGISSGANLAAAIRIGKEREWNIALPLCDRGERYFSRSIFGT